MRMTIFYYLTFLRSFIFGANFFLDIVQIRRWGRGVSSIPECPNLVRPNWGWGGSIFWTMPKNQEFFKASLRKDVGFYII